MKEFILNLFKLWSWRRLSTWKCKIWSIKKSVINYARWIELGTTSPNSVSMQVHVLIELMAIIVHKETIR